ncbi:HalOD1 output domain-containing protein [Halorussus salinisoli]|uniref:HalOD1 output domain-containing protein n=1 Tax=Halorussus salinisoli TaxID=2558242 RepID=UPI002A915F6F|nr:HalOD1 output domain-containing protein [Halorussus salinisoli]
MTTIEFDANRELFQAVYDRNQDSVGLAVVALVATVLDKEPDHLAPLYSSIDEDEFEGLLQETTDTRRGQGHISFNYEGFEVTVFGDGKIEADPTGDHVVGIAG